MHGWHSGGVNTLDLAAHANRIDGALSIPAGGLSRLLPGQRSARDRLNADRIDRWIGEPLADAVGASAALSWLGVMAAAPRDLQRAVEELTGCMNPGDPADTATIEQWHTVLGGAAPLAWAAGLTLVEARDRQVAGLLSEPDLRARAVLRGFRFLP